MIKLADVDLFINVWYFIAQNGDVTQCTGIAQDGLQAVWQYGHCRLLQRTWCTGQFLNSQDLIIQYKTLLSHDKYNVINIILYNRILYVSIYY